MDELHAKQFGYSVVGASWLAVFVLCGYGSILGVLLELMKKNMGWGTTELFYGLSVMMIIYAIAAYFSGYIIDRWDTRLAYFIGAICTALGFLFISECHSGCLAYLFLYAIFTGSGTGMLWVSSTVSVRKWYVGKTYATMWGIAFMGGPVAQLFLGLGIKSFIATMDCSVVMRGLAVVTFITLISASIFSKKTPEYYKLEPFGSDSIKAEQREYRFEWTVSSAFKEWAVWGAIIAFITCVISEFLVWMQVVNYWTRDISLSQSTANHLYLIMCIASIILMPLMGVAADKIVEIVNSETQGRRVMLVFAPIVGIVACCSLLATKYSIIYGVTSCILFAVYWAIEPGGVAGYIGSLFGGKAFGRIMGLSSSAVMGVGPIMSSLLGGYFFKFSMHYDNSLLFAILSFLISAIIASTLPAAVVSPVESNRT